MEHAAHFPDMSRIYEILQILDNRYGDNSELIQQVDTRLRGRSLALFLGAGISLDANVPDWQGLLHGLTRKLKPEPRNGSDLILEVYYQLNRQAPLILGQQLEDHLDKRFIHEIRSLLYSMVQPSNTIKAIANLCARTEPIPRVITYNYDDLLEEELRERGVPFNLIVEPNHEFSEDILNVIHIHGYVPRSAAEADHSGIVLGEQKYYALWNRPFDWINIAQLTTLVQYQALFIGFSFNDPNVRRLLEISTKHVPGKRHFAILRRIHPNDLLDAIAYSCKLDVNTPSGRITALRKLSELSDSLGWLFDMQADLYQTLGLQVLWVNQYSDIPYLINELAKI